MSLALPRGLPVTGALDVAGPALRAARDWGLGWFKVSSCHCICLGTASSRVGVPPYQPLRVSPSPSDPSCGVFCCSLAPFPGKGRFVWLTPYVLAHSVGGCGPRPR